MESIYGPSSPDSLMLGKICHSCGYPCHGVGGSENTDPPTPPLAGANARLIAHLDSANNIYIADWGNNALTQVLAGIACTKVVWSTAGHPPTLVFFVTGSRPAHRTRSPLPSLVRCEHELGARGCGYRQWERGARAQRRRWFPPR